LIEVPGAPPVGGLFFRSFVGDSDYHSMADIINACNDVDKLDRYATRQDIASSYKHLINCNPLEDMLFAQINHIPCAYSRVSWREEGDKKRIYSHLGFVRPDMRNKGIGRAMLRYNQNRLRDIAAEHEDQKERFFESYAVDTEYATSRLLESDGYLPERYFFVMVRPNLENLPEAKLPEGLEVRPVDRSQYQIICDASAEAFRDHWGFSEEAEPTVEEWVDDPNFDPTLWRVAWDGDHVAGMVLSYINHQENNRFNRKRGYPENICVRRPWRRRGLARALLVQSLHAIKDRDMEEAALGVDTQNLSGALGLYEGVGFEPVKRSTIYRKPFND
jgi:ribosomal protein S18 acetylase RimI-like enzyme